MHTSAAPHDRPTATRLVRVLCHPTIAPGFELASLRPRVATADDAEDALEELCADPNTGVVLVQSELYEAAAGATLRRLERQPLPVILPFPGPRWKARPSPEEYVVELLRRAIGYRVRLR
ncbi:MAG: V-type ATP synthase subunit F [Gemmatimonadota bacterium]